MKIMKFSALFGLLFVTPAAAQQAVEYVEICDKYGVGFLYIPDTQTCYRVTDGQIRYENADGVEVVTESELAARVSSLESDTAIAMALEDPDLVAGERFGVRVNWGAAGSQNAAGISGTVVLGENLFGKTGRIAGSGAVGFTGGRVGGRAGMQLTW